MARRLSILLIVASPCRPYGAPPTLPGLARAVAGAAWPVSQPRSLPSETWLTHRHGVHLRPGGEPATLCPFGNVAQPPPPRVSAQGGAEAGGVAPPVVVLAAVDEGDRHLVPEPALEVGVAVDGDLGVGLPQLVADLHDHHPGVVAQVTAGPRVEGDPCVAHSSSPRER